MKSVWALLIIGSLLAGLFFLLGGSRVVEVPAINWNGPFDPLFYEWGQRYGIEPAILKAVGQIESGFNPTAVNPESASVPADVLRDEILHSPDGGDTVLGKYRVDPSMGIMQVRVSTARQFFSVRPVDLFEPGLNIRSGSAFLNFIKNSGIPLPGGVEAYNVGAAGYRAGRRNPAYKARFDQAYTSAKGDFPA